MTLDGYHVGQDWVIALMYDDESQSAQGMLSHRIRLDEIEQVLQKQQPELQALDQIIVQQKDELGQLQVDLQQNNKSLNKTKDLQQLDVQIAKQQTAAQAFYCKTAIERSTRSVRYAA